MVWLTSTKKTLDSIALDILVGCKDGVVGRSEGGYDTEELTLEPCLAQNSRASASARGKSSFLFL